MEPSSPSLLHANQRASSRQWAWGDGEVGDCKGPTSFSGGEGKQEAVAGGVGALP